MLGQIAAGAKPHDALVRPIARRIDLDLRGRLKRAHGDTEDFPDLPGNAAVPWKRDLDPRVGVRGAFEVQPGRLVSELHRQLELAGAGWNSPPDDPLLTAAFSADETKRVVANLEPDALKVRSVRFERAAVHTDRHIRRGGFEDDPARAAGYRRIDAGARRNFDRA